MVQILTATDGTNHQIIMHGTALAGTAGGNTFLGNVLCSIFHNMAFSDSLSGGHKLG